MRQQQEYSLARHDLQRTFSSKYPDLARVGWGPRLRDRFGYFTPDDHYEALVAALVQQGTVWADVGCGRDLFPSNQGLARELAGRAEFVLGIDPDANIHQNKFLSLAVQAELDTYVPDRLYDVVTLRMVAEHIANPAATARTISSMLKRGGVAVIYTPHKWAPLSVLARITPMGAHHFFKKILWSTEERDTFPVQFKMNTRSALQGTFHEVGMYEAHFALVDDCRVFQRFFVLNYLELSLRKLCNATHIRYPEACILAVYRKS